MVYLYARSLHNHENLSFQKIFYNIKNAYIMLNFKSKIQNRNSTL